MSLLPAVLELERQARPALGRVLEQRAPGQARVLEQALEQGPLPEGQPEVLVAQRVA